MTVPVCQHFYLLSLGLDMGQARVYLPLATMGTWAGRDYVIYMDKWLKILKFYLNNFPRIPTWVSAPDA